MKRRPHKEQLKLQKLLISMVLVLVAAGMGWYWWVGSVYYSLAQIRHAVTARDRYRFEKYVDVPGVSRRLVDDMASLAVERTTETPVANNWESVGQGLGIAFLEMWKPRLTETIQQSVIRAVESGALERGDFEVAAQESGTSTTEPTILTAIPNLKPRNNSKVSVTVQGSTALVLLLVQDATAKPQYINFRLARTPDRYWRVTEIANARDLMRSNVDGNAASATASQRVRAAIPQPASDDPERRTYLSGIQSKIQRTVASTNVPSMLPLGNLMVGFNVLPNGQVENVRVVSGNSGSKILRDLAVQIVKQSAPFGPLPSTLTSGPLELTVPIEFASGE